MHISKGLVLLISATLTTVFSAPIIPRDYTSIAEQTSHHTVHRANEGTLVSEHVHHVDTKPVPHAFVDIYPRAPDPSRGAFKAAKVAAKAARVEKAAAKGKVAPKRPSNPKRPDNAKITFGDAARAKLDELGIHGKDRKKVKEYHKNIVKQDMAKHGAASARVFHLAHTGGTDPNERNHLTVGYFKPPVGGKPGEQIKSPWAQKYEHDNPGKTTKGLFHVYPEDQTHKTPVPPAWSHATAASDARKHAEAAAAAAHAEAEHKAKQERVSQEKAAGQSLSQADKIAQRQAAKAAKAARKTGGTS